MPTPDIFTDSGQGEDGDFNLDDYDNHGLELDDEEEDDTGDYNDRDVGTKRKRVGTDALESELNRSDRLTHASKLKVERHLSLTIALPLWPINTALKQLARFAVVSHHAFLVSIH